MWMSSLKAVMKMIGVRSELLRWRTSAAVSKPSMIGILTSSRMTAHSCSSSRRNASRPEAAVTTFCPGSDRMASNDSRFSALSSTTRMLTRSPRVILLALGPRWRRLRAVLPVQPAPQHRKHVLGVHRLGQVVPGPGFQRLLAVALHRLGGDRDDRQVLPARRTAEGGDSLPAGPV